MKQVNINPFANDLYGTIGQMIKKALYSFQTCIPAIVKEVGENRGYVVATPAVQQTDIQQESIPWADIKLPVYTPFSNSVLISCPLAVGDTGWIVAGDLDPSLFLADTSKTAKQGVFTRHEYQFGFFIPCRLGEYSVDSGEENAFIVKYGDTKITIKGEEVSISSSNPLKINAKSVSITSEGNDVKIDGINFKNHTHTTDVPALTVTNATPAGAGPVVTVAQSVTSGGVDS